MILYDYFEYKICITPKQNAKQNPFHEILDGSIGTIDFLEIGFPLRGKYYLKNKPNDLPRYFITSTVLNYVEKEDGNIFVETENTFYKFQFVRNALI